jgi:hypothetical protein
LLSLKPQPGVEIDHQEPLALGGADTIQNLWPQPRGAVPWNAEMKDELEYRAVVAACYRHTMSLSRGSGLRPVVGPHDAAEL